MFSLDYRLFLKATSTRVDIKMQSEKKKKRLASSQTVLPVIDCRDVVLTWHTLGTAALSLSAQLPAYIQLFVRLAGRLSRLPCCVCFLVSVCSPEVRSPSSAEDHTRTDTSGKSKLAALAS